MEPCDEIRLKVHDLAFDLLDDQERRQVEAHIESCEACRQAHEAAVRERELLKRWAVPEPPPGLADRAIAAAQAAAGRRKEPTMTATPIEPQLRWLGSRRFWGVAAAVALLVGAGFWYQWHRISRRAAAAEERFTSALVAKPQEAFLYGQGELCPGLPATYRLPSNPARTHGAAADAESAVRTSRSPGPATRRMRRSCQYDRIHRPPAWRPSLPSGP